MNARTIALCVALVTPSAAFAGKDKEESTPAEIVESGIAEFDDVFMKAKSIHTSLDNATTDIAECRTAIREAVGAAEDATVATALQSLNEKANGSLKVAMDGQTPKLSADDAPEEVKTAVANINASIDGVVAAITELQALPAEAQALASEAQAFPGKLNPGLLQSNNLKVTQLGKVTKTVGSNSKAVGSTPSRITEVADEATSLLGDISSAFGG